MAPPHPKIPPSALPTREAFDAWNTSSTGHQHAENRLSSSTSWRASRMKKLHSQFASGHMGGGGKRISDTVGAGSKDFGRDGRTETGWENSVRGWRGREGLRGIPDIGEWLNGKGKGTMGPGRARKRRADEEHEAICKLARRDEDDHIPPSGQRRPSPTPASPDLSEDEETPSRTNDDETTTTTTTTTPASASRTPIFASLTMYINGSTYPLVSDHRLKYLLTSHGASVALGLGRRTVTHVIIGKPNGGSGVGAGGGLAGSKIEKEIRRVGGKGVKFVGVEW